MKRNIEVLNYVYQNAEMGITGIDDISDKIEDEELKEVTRTQREGYLKISKEAIQIFIKYGQQEAELGKLAKINSYLMIKVKTMIDDSTSNIAKMLIEGSNKGILEITEKINQYQGIDEEIIDLAEKLKKLEESNLEELKKYL